MRLGESFGTDSTAVFSNYSTGDIFRGFGSTGLVFRILNDGSFIANGTKSAVVDTVSFAVAELMLTAPKSRSSLDFSVHDLPPPCLATSALPSWTERIQTRPVNKHSS
jgi:hypothetical protein